jgi:hypothetical protein
MFLLKCLVELGNRELTEKAKKIGQGLDCWKVSQDP